MFLSSLRVSTMYNSSLSVIVLLTSSETKGSLCNVTTQTKWYGHFYLMESSHLPSVKNLISLGTFLNEDIPKDIRNTEKVISTTLAHKVKMTSEGNLDMGKAYIYILGDRRTKFRKSGGWMVINVKQKDVTSVSCWCYKKQFVNQTTWLQ